VCHASRLRRSQNAAKSAEGRQATIDTFGAPLRSVPSEAIRELRSGGQASGAHRHPCTAF
jgi:hypothetical protein